MLLFLLFAAYEPLAPGLEIQELTLAPKVSISDSKVIVVRIDPKVAKLVLLSANTLGEKAKTAGDWAKQHRLSVVINASMFHPDGVSTGYMRAAKKTNGMANKDKAVFAFGPTLAHIFDQQCEPFTFGAADNAVQNIRMLGCNGENMWAKSAKKWSTACVGEDEEGHILFIHVRSPLDVHDLIDRLNALPLGLTRLMYVEGGPEATLFVDTGGKRMVRVGSYETGFNENDENVAQWDLPNVIGVLR